MDIYGSGHHLTGAGLAQIPKGAAVTQLKLPCSFSSQDTVCCVLAGGLEARK